MRPLLLSFALLLALPVRAQGNCSDGTTGALLSVSQAILDEAAGTFRICFALEGDPAEPLGAGFIGLGFNHFDPGMGGMRWTGTDYPPASPYNSGGYTTHFNPCLAKPLPCAEVQIENPTGPYVALSSTPVEFICVNFTVTDPSTTTGIFTSLISLARPDGTLIPSCPLEDQAVYDEPLPVELTAFDAVVDGPDVLLRWTTASETNNTGFEVEHRAPSASAFEPSGFVAGHGTTTEAQTYRHRVTDLWPGTHTFRLKQVDFDGTFEYGPEVEVDVAVPGAVLAQAYPTPANPHVTFTFVVGEDQHVVAEVFDLRGRRVAQPFRQAAVAQQTYTLTVGAGLPSGVYVLRLLGDRLERPYTSRFVIAR